MSVGRSERLVGRDSELTAFRDWFAQVGPGPGGVYVIAGSAYGEATYARLASVKNHWDPGNLFRLNQNIPPSRLSV